MSEIKLSLRTIFNEAVEIEDAKQRGEYLARACGADTALRKSIEELIDANNEAGRFLGGAGDTATVQKAANRTPPDAVITEQAGDRIDRYKLLQKIGEGGCGVVYMAEQQEPVRRRVALKVIKLGMDTRSVIARFEAERQALALMDHPNIAKVLDAGATETGRPYFVMELVKGMRITDYCDQNNLPTPERLALFTLVCHAIQHAHQKGIIHRDIKPSNILVTLHDGVPVPKVIDFGIAKATTNQRLTDKTLFTAFEQFMGTPAYMSPEQAEMSGLDIDTRSDVYALGVLLYELLTGKTPFDARDLLASGLDAMRRTIREQEPARPSTRLSTMLAADLAVVAKQRQTESAKLASSIRGDLDWIVMKSLEKDRARRYETSNGLAMDVERHLKSEPVLARPPTTAYRTAKLLRRHRAAAAAVATLALLLLSGLGLTLLLLAREAKARHQAAREAQKNMEVTTFLKDMFGSLSSEEYQRMDKTLLVTLANRAASRVGEELHGEPEVEAELRTTLGRVYMAAMEWEDASSMLEGALRIRVTLFGSNSLPAAESMAQLAYAIGMRDYSPILSGAKTSPNQKPTEMDRAEELARAALDTRRRLLGPESPEVAESLRFLGLIRRDKGDLPGARLAYRDAFAIFETSHRPAARFEVRNLSMLAAFNEEQAGNFSEAEKWLRRGMACSQQPGEEVFLIASAQRLAMVLRTQTNFPAAENLLEETLATLGQRGAFTKPETARGAVSLWTRLGDLYVAQTNWSAAGQAYGRALDLAQAHGDEAGAVWFQTITRLLSKKSFAYQSQGDFSKAEAALIEASNILDSSSHSPPQSIVDVSSHLADLYAAWGKPDQEAKWRQRLDELKRGQQPRDQDTKPAAEQTR